MSTSVLATMVHMSESSIRCRQELVRNTRLNKLDALSVEERLQQMRDKSSPITSFANEDTNLLRGRQVTFAPRPESIPVVRFDIHVKIVPFLSGPTERPYYNEKERFQYLVDHPVVFRVISRRLKCIQEADDLLVLTRANTRVNTPSAALPKDGKYCSSVNSKQPTLTGKFS